MTERRTCPAPAWDRVLGGPLHLRSRPRHDAVGVGLGFAFEAVAGVADRQPVAVVRAGDGPLALLDHVGEFVREGVLVTAAVADDDVVAGRVGAGPDPGGRGAGGAAFVDADLGEVRAQAGLHLLAQRGVERPAGPGQHVVDGGPLYPGTGRPDLLVAAVRSVPVLGVPGPGQLQHVQHRGVSDTALKGHDADVVHRGADPRCRPFTGGLVGASLVQQLNAFRRRDRPAPRNTPQAVSGRCARADPGQTRCPQGPGQGTPRTAGPYGYSARSSLGRGGSGTSGTLLRSAGSSVSALMRKSAVSTTSG